MPTIEAAPAGVVEPRQPRQQAARPHEVARRHDGHRRAARRASSRSASSSSARPPTPAASPPRSQRARRRAGRHGHRRSRPTSAAPIEFSGLVALRQVGARQRRARSRQRHGERVRALPPRRHHPRPVPRPRRGPARPRRRDPHHEPPELRAARPHRGPARPRCSSASPRSTWPPPAPSSPATSSPARAPTPATSRSRSRAASRATSTRRSRRPGLAEVGGVRINISGCTNSCGQHHISDIGFFGLERRAHGQAAPGYQMLLGGTRRRHGDRVRREGHEAAGQGRVAGRRAGGRASSPPSARPARRSPQWLDRTGGAAGVGKTLEDLDVFPDPGRAPRLLRRLRRDRAVRGGDRRQRVRDMTRTPHDSTPVSSSPSSPTSPSSPRSSRELETQPATSAIEWAWDRFGPDVVLAASFQDCVLIDLAVAGGARRRGRVPRHQLPLRRDALVRRAGPQPATTSTSR